MKKPFSFFIGLVFLTMQNIAQTDTDIAKSLDCTFLAGNKILSEGKSDGTNIKKTSSLEYLKKTKKKYNPANIIHQIPSPVELVMDIAYDGNYLWVAGFVENYYYKISTTDGTIIKMIPSHGNETPRGLAFDGNYLWVVNSDKDSIYKIDTLNGNIINKYRTPTINNNFPVGLAWDGSFLWHIDAICGSCIDSLKIFKLDSDLNVIKSKTISTRGHGSGLTFAKDNLWYTDNYNDIFINLDTINFNVLDEMQAPGGDFPNGITFDGQYLWVANGDKDSIYQIDAGFNSVNNIDNINVLKIYPNPAIDRVYINCADKQDLKLQIYNVLGECILQRELKNNINEIDVCLFPKGIYIIKVIGSDWAEQLKLIKE